MSQGRPRKHRTLADYVGTAISPALIVGMVLSLTLFLLQMIYAGKFEGGFRWVLVWFVIASVLITRISIEQGSQTASAFGTALGIATALVTMLFAPETKSGVNSVAIVWGLMVLIWWCSSKLTWDCTLIDDSQDASGEGLLEAAGLHTVDPDGVEEPDHPDTGSDRATVYATVPVWERILFNRAAQSSKAHSPGMWIVYVSLIGLPVMGVGQRWLEKDEQALGFAFLFAFVASAMGLLLTTSFLGLRRYLRQRNLQMPGNVTRSWLITGTVLLLGILVGSLLVPRPDATYSLGSVVEWSTIKDPLEALPAEDAPPDWPRDRDGQKGAASPVPPSDLPERSSRNHERQKSPPRKRGPQMDAIPKDQFTGDRFAEGKRFRDRQAQEQRSPDGRFAKYRDQRSRDKQNRNQPNDVRESSSSDAANQQGERRNVADRQNRSREPGNRKRAGRRKGGAQKSDSQGGGGASGGGSGGANVTPPPPPPANPLDFFAFDGAPLVLVAQIVSNVLFGLFVLFMLVKHGRTLWKAFLEMLSAIKGFFLRRRLKKPDDASEAPREETPGFSSYSNPFSDGTVLRATPSEMVCLTFEALEAWAQEVGHGRLPDQTPREFAARLSASHQQESGPIRRLATDYSRIAYGNLPPNEEWREGLDRLWSWMILSHKSR
mgnify:CR=1 FL=1